MNSQPTNSKVTRPRARSYFAPRVILPTMPRAFSLILRLGFAVLMVCAASLLKFALDPEFSGRAPFLFFFGAVALSAWFGGFGGGTLATILCASIHYNLIWNLHAGSSFVDFVQIALFVVESLAISFLIQTTRNAQSQSTKRALELQASEDRYRQVLDTAFLGIWIMNPQAETVYANEYFATLLGYTRTEMQGASLFEFIPPENRDAARENFEKRRQGVRAQYELRLMRKDGSTLWVQTSSTPLQDKSGQFEGTMAMITDISGRRQTEAALRQSEERYRAFVEHSTEAIWCFESENPLDPNSPIEQQIEQCYEYSYLAECNDAMAKMHGFENATQVVGARLIDFLPRTPENLAYLRNFIESGYRMTNAESREFVKSGSPKFFSNNLIGLRENGLIYRSWGMQRDITLEKEIEIQRAELLRREHLARVAAENSQREAESASLAKDQFLATLSHELRTPLNSIMGWAQLLNDEDLDAETMKYALSAIERNARLQAQLVEDLLDISRITMGRMQIEPAPLLFHEVVEAAIQIVLPAAKARETVINYDAFEYSKSSPDDLINGDASRLQQVVCNLLSNAIKFAPEHGCVCVKQTTNDEVVRLEISDNGKGIETQFLAHIFEAFRQADSSSTRAHGGVGLGLHIVKTIVDLHGGTIEARSEGANLGALFIIELPRLETLPD